VKISGYRNRRGSTDDPDQVVAGQSRLFGLFLDGSVLLMLKRGSTRFTRIPVLGGGACV